MADRVFFTGEQALTEVPNWYRHADIFVYTSLSETYGQVISEALWCGLPVVAFADSMGVSSQVSSGVDGMLVEPGPDARTADWRFAKEVVSLLRNPRRRRAMAEAAVANARERCSPGRSIARYYEAFEVAREHCATHAGSTATLRRLAPLARWTWMHAVLAGLGCLRAPADHARHRGQPPSWDGPIGDEPLRHTQPPPPLSETEGLEEVSTETAV